MGFEIFRRKIRGTLRWWFLEEKPVGLRFFRIKTISEGFIRNSGFWVFRKRASVEEIKILLRLGSDVGLMSIIVLLI